MLTAQLTRAREAGATARLTLSSLMGIEAVETTLSSDFRQTPIAVDETAFVWAAFRSSSERAVLLHKIDRAATMLSVEKGSGPFLPDLSLNLSIDVTGQKVPLSGASASRIERAKVTLETAKQGLRGFELGLEIQVRSFTETVKTAWSFVHRVTAELELAKEIQRNAAVSFDNQLITRAAALSAKLAVLAAELEYELALFTYETALIELEMLFPRPL